MKRMECFLEEMGRCHPDDGPGGSAAGLPTLGTLALLCLSPNPPDQLQVSDVKQGWIWGGASAGALL